MNTSATTFSKCFHADNPTLWDEFIQRFSATPGHVCYYPSAGSDFRPLVYQQTVGMGKLNLVETGDLLPGLEHGEQATHPAQDYEVPDLWLFSDYCGQEEPAWIESGILHRDERVAVRVISMTEVHPAARQINVKLNTAYVDLRPSSATGRAFYLRLSVENPVTGRVEVDAIYFCYENVNLIHQFLLRHQVPISHLIWVRDGSGLGGGRLRHDFLVPLLPLLRTRWLFIGEPYWNNLQDEDFWRRVRRPRELRYYEKYFSNEISPIQEIGRFQSSGDRLVFCDLAIQSLVYDSDPEDNLTKSFSPAEIADPVYLWLCCEGWMRFGPYKWLRFDDNSGAILDHRGKAVAWRCGVVWRTSNPRGDGMEFSDPTITNSSQHPHKNSASPPHQRIRTSIAAWQDFYDGEFQSLLSAVLHQFPDKSDCPDCRAPKELRLRLPKWPELRTVVPDSVAERFFCCWYGTALVAQGMHQFLRGCYPAWSSRNFCPLPVHEAREGRFQVSSSQDLLTVKSPSFETWNDFIPFFRQRILGEVEKLAGMNPEGFMAEILSSRERQGQSRHPLETLLFSAIFPEKRKP